MSANNNTVVSDLLVHQCFAVFKIKLIKLNRKIQKIQNLKFTVSTACKLQLSLFQLSLSHVW